MSKLLQISFLIVVASGLAVAEAPFPECPPSGCDNKAVPVMVAEAPFPECPPSGCDNKAVPVVVAEAPFPECPPSGCDNKAMPVAVAARFDERPVGGRATRG